MTRPVTRLILAACVLLATTWTTAADLVVDATNAPAADVVQVVVPVSTCAATDAAGTTLAFAHQPRASAKQPGEVWIYGLDKEGGIVAASPPPTTLPATGPAKPVVRGPKRPAPAATVPEPLHKIILPRPQSLSESLSAAHCLVFHPKLPLLYVWQDITAPPPKGLRSSPVFDEFDHLLIYRLSPDAPPRLELATARGAEFTYGLKNASMVLDGGAKRLFLPNLRVFPTEKTIHAAVGFVRIGEDGMPVREGEKLALTIEGLPAHFEMPAATGFAPVSDSVTIFGGRHGPATWDAASRRGKFSSYFLSGLPPGMHYLVGHPVLQKVYVSGVGSGTIWRMDHADGYLTMQPQQITISGATLRSPPIVSLERNELIVAGTGKVYFVKLDANGNFAGTATHTTVNSVTTEAMTYSPKFNRVYVAVDKVP